jgi:hypothetical protein
MNTYYLKYQKYKNKYINLKYLQQGGAEQNLVYNRVSQLIENNNLAIGNPKQISNKKNILSMVDKSDALKFSYDTLTKNFTVETPGEYKGTILTMDDRGSEVRFCQLWGSISGLNRQQFEVDENAIYVIDTNIFILKVFGDDLTKSGNLLFKQIEIIPSNKEILLKLASFQQNGLIVVKKIIESDIDIDINWTEILRNAIRSKNSDIVSLLLTKATDINAAINLNDLYIFTKGLLDKSSYYIDKGKLSNILTIIESMIKQYLTFELDYNFDKIIDIDKDILNQISTFIENNIIGQYSNVSSEGIKKDTIKKLHALFEIKRSTLKKIIIIVPGDSGFRQVKAIELYLKKTKQDKDIQFVYIPLSGITNIEPTDELLQYFKESINGTRENDFIIYDYYDKGRTINLIQNILNKLYENPYIHLQKIPFFRLLTNAVHRCQPQKHFPHIDTESVSQEDYIHCTSVIAWLFNTLINAV